MSLLDLLFPRRCLGCGKKESYFCPSCIKEIKPLEHQIYSPKYPLDGLFSIFLYQGIIRRAILKLKYNFVLDLADELIDLAVRLFKQSHFDYSNCLTFVPIPLHWHRKNWRGFNQTEILGKRLAEKLKIDFCSDLLLRTRMTKPQVKLKRKKRKKNVRGAFKVHNSYSKGLPQRGQILLFDDVWTTGTTMKECARVLKNAGVKKVFGLTLARKVSRLADHVPPPSPVNLAR